MFSPGFWQQINTAIIDFIYWLDGSQTFVHWRCIMMCNSVLIQELTGLYYFVLLLFILTHKLAVRDNQVYSFFCFFRSSLYLYGIMSFNYIRRQHRWDSDNWQPAILFTFYMMYCINFILASKSCMCTVNEVRFIKLCKSKQRQIRWSEVYSVDSSNYKPCYMA